MTPVESVFHEVLRFETALWAEVDAQVRGRHGLALERYEVLRSVVELGGAPRVNDIAHYLAITVGATSKLVDRLESSGYCERRANPTDRRSSLISLTGSGARMCADASKTFNSALEGLIGAHLSSSEQQVLVSTLQRLRGLSVPGAAAARVVA